ncbi:MAG: milk-clotting protease [Mucilaginibacter sp.]|nr:milk-clotting protease [Mucilaginibacter sp.]
MNSIKHTVSKAILIVSLFALAFSGCQKDQKNTSIKITKAGPIPTDVLAKIKASGFSTDQVVKVKEGYLVEGDIVLTEAFLNANIVKPAPLVTTDSQGHKTTITVDQYRVTNPVSPSNQHTFVTFKILVTGLSSGYLSATDEAILRYNNQYLDIRFQRITSGTPDITISGYYDNTTSTEGYSGFPSSGVPYNSIQLNTYWYGTNPTNTPFTASVIQHELGHCVGMRHTDYADRSFSCGGLPSNEGAGANGAVQIPGTPSGPDAASWMLACNDGVSNRTFNANDIIALNYLFPYLPGINGTGTYAWTATGSGSGTITAKPGTIVGLAIAAFGPGNSVNFSISGALLNGSLSSVTVSNNDIPYTFTMPSTGSVSWSASYTTPTGGGSGNIAPYVASAPILPTVNINGATSYKWTLAGTFTGTIKAPAGRVVSVTFNLEGPMSVNFTLSGVNFTGTTSGNVVVSSNYVVKTFTMPASGTVNWSGVFSSNPGNGEIDVN